MPIFLDTTGLTSLAIGVCDRCKMKRAFVTLGPDPNFPDCGCVTKGAGINLIPTAFPPVKPNVSTCGSRDLMFQSVLVITTC